MIGISVKDIPIDCLPESYRNKIFVGTSYKKACDPRDGEGKYFDKNLPILEGGVCPEISDYEKIPIKEG